MLPSSRSIFSSSIRSFCVAFFAILGICLALFIFFILMGGLMGGSKNGASLDVQYEVVASSDFKRESLAFTGPVILQIDIEGVIGLDHLDGQWIYEQLVETQEGLIAKDRFKAILLNVNTPGGTILDSDKIYRAISSFKQQYHIPVYTFVDGYLASGGMYIACASDKIFATKTSVIGSVGVYHQFFNVVDLLDKVGIKNLTLSKGLYKDALNPFKKWNIGDEKDYAQMVEYYYDHFVSLVVKARKNIAREDLVEIYGAKIFPAPLALSYGFIDGDDLSKQEVIEMLARDAGIDKDDHYQVVRFMHKKWLGSLFESSLQNEVKHKIDIPGVDLRLANQYLYLYQP